MATATFQAEGHLYTHDGRIVPSVTQAMELAGLDDYARVPRRNLEHAAAVGTAVHKACEFLDEEDLDLESLDPTVVGYVLGYQKFKQECGFTPLIVERRGVSISATNNLAYGFCLDRIGMLNGVEVLIDIKTALKKSANWGVQTAAYAEAVNFDGARRAVHVTKKGEYHVIPYEAAEDFETWNAALQIAHWRLAHGAKLP